MRFPRKYPFSNQFLRILDHLNLLNGRIDLLLVDDLIAANYKCNPIKGPKLDYQIVNSAIKKGPGNRRFPGQSNREASRLGRR